MMCMGSLPVYMTRSATFGSVEGLTDMAPQQGEVASTILSPPKPSGHFIRPAAEGLFIRLQSELFSAVRSQFKYAALPWLDHRNTLMS